MTAARPQPDDGGDDELERALRPMRRTPADAVRWTAAFSGGAAIAGVLWGAVFYVSGLRPDATTFTSSPRILTVVAGCCIALTASGAALAAGPRRRLRTVGVALLVAGLAGPVVAGLLGVQRLAAGSPVGRGVVLALAVLALVVWVRRNRRRQRSDRDAGWHAAVAHSAGLLIGVAAGFVLVVAMFVFAAPALGLVALVLGLSQRTRGVAGGVVAAMVGIATFIATIYSALAAFGG